MSPPVIRPVVYFFRPARCYSFRVLRVQKLPVATGDDGFQVTLTSPTAPGVTLHYTAWKQITDDIDDARVFGGIHFRYDQEAGARQGWQVGSFILETRLLPLSQE